ncbi:MAG: IgGFc-binding protein [Polyangiaceae bacterium]
MSSWFGWGSWALLAACSASSAPPGSSIGEGGQSTASGGANTSGGALASGGATASGGTVMLGFGGSAAEAGTGNQGGDGNVRDPKTCAEAEKFRTYLGCEFYPTVLANVVSPVFDFAVVVANASDEVATIQVEGPNAFTSSASVAAHGLVTIYLPWVDSLKGPGLSNTCSAAAMTGSVLAQKGAYHLTSSRPVAAYQFSPLEFRAAGGPAGKQWGCVAGVSPLCECNSYSNDASLLLPKNALTSNYVAFTWRDQGNASSSKPATIAITALVDATEIAVKTGPKANLQAGPSGSNLPAVGPDQVFRFTLDHHDVVELVAVAGSDLSGTQIQASEQKPIQVMSGSPSGTSPSDSVRSADHMEEVVFPAESVGSDYVVPVGTGPHGTPVAHTVRIYGHAKASTLSYFPSKPSGAPDSVAPGAVSEFQTSSDFQVRGTEPFAVGSFLVGGQLLDPAASSQDSMGDPSESFLTTVAQYRDRYVFLAPIDYDANFVDVVVPSGVTLKLDGKDLDPASGTALAGRATDGSTAREFHILRVKLDAGSAFVGSHEITASAPVGIQVLGYGRFTSYQYPGGLNLNLIAEPPITIPR